MKQRAIILLLTLCLGGLVFSADLVTFMNLGFSADSKAFAFGSFSTRSDRMPLSELFIVDVANNKFVPGGVKSQIGARNLSLGQDGSNAMIKFLIGQRDLLNAHKIDLENTGRPLYILLNGDDKSLDISFKDFVNSDSYSLKLIDKIQAGGGSFHIELSHERKGAKKSYIVGNKNTIRAGVAGHKIRQVILGPDNRSIVIVIEKLHVANSATISSYMVETLVL